VSIKKILDNIWLKINQENKKRIYRNLVFKGGGVRGIAYMGALEVLEELSVLQNIERVAGTSSGAIAATLVSFHKNTRDTIDLFNTLDLKKVPQRAVNDGSWNTKILKNSENYPRLFEKYGWYSSAYFHDWLKTIVAEQCRGNPRATFADFQKLGFHDLHIIASNISRHRAQVFSAKNTPNVAVADAVRMSMSIPLFFEALRFDGRKFGAKGDYFVDGGLFNNYPIHIFDQPEYAIGNRFYRDGINLETLGLFLYPSSLHNKGKVDEPKNLWEFLDLIVRSMNDSRQLANLAENVADKKRTIEINDGGISSTQFDLSPQSVEYHTLFENGRIATERFFEMINNR
jgi:NTE family protein